MEINQQDAKEFARLLIMRGFGLYGEKKMVKICSDSEIACRSDGSFDYDEEHTEEALTKLMLNYAKFNLPAKMTVLILAKKYGITIPEELKSSTKKKSKYRQRNEKGN